MEQKELQMLADVYNNLLNISVKGEDVFTLSECMSRLRQFIINKQQELKDKKENEDG